jgi:bifunctional N-acetylglucosamine-1-phosphate-uridyltransferase/glucosamine-1-phosphate-acetyltransferase GlmU-like protein
MEEKTKVESIQIDPHEALGVNSKEELEILEKLIRK